MVDLAKWAVCPWSRCWLAISLYYDWISFSESTGEFEKLRDEGNSNNCTAANTVRSIGYTGMQDTGGLVELWFCQQGGGGKWEL